MTWLWLLLLDIGLFAFLYGWSVFFDRRYWNWRKPK